MVATASCEDVKKETDKIQEESQNIEKRGLHSSFGGHEWSGYSGGDGGHSSYGGGDSGHSSYGGGSDHGHHHEHIKTVTIEKKYPVPYEVIKKIPYTVEKKVSHATKKNNNSLIITSCAAQRQSGHETRKRSFMISISIKLSTLFVTFQLISMHADIVSQHLLCLLRNVN